MASEKSEKSEKEASPKKKVKGKGKQSGNWFHRNKAFITWALAIAFASTCIGFTGIAYVTQAEKDKESKQVKEMTVDRIAENIKFWEGKLASSPGKSRVCIPGERFRYYRQEPRQAYERYRQETIRRPSQNGRRPL